jgi:uncharacterized protein (TIGR02391 family)
MQSSLTTTFPSAQNVLDAPVFDVAGVMLTLIAQRTSNNSYVTPNNEISGWASPYGQHDRDAVTRALSEAWAWLVANGFIAEEFKQGVGHPGIFVTRAGQKIRSRADFLAYAKSSLLPSEILRADLAEVVRPLFLGGHFDAAVSSAFIQVEVYVRTVSGLPNDLVGIPLMRKAFHPETGPLTDVNAVPAEREAIMHLFSGAIGTYKNPLSHHVVGLSNATVAASRILVANELLAQANYHAIVRGLAGTSAAP